MKMTLQEIPIREVVVGENRYRKEPGDIDGLMANIREMGLLEPIGVDRKYQLIYGERRLAACRELGWRTIPCVTVNLKSVLAGQYAENEFRKAFTPSERRAIAAAIEAELGNRKGQRTDLGANAPKLPKGKTADIAAKRAGFGSRETYERAKVATDRGTPDLVAAMDKGELSITAAATIASQPETEQGRILAMPKDEQGEVVRRIRKTKADQELDERRSRDILIFRGLAEAVRVVAEFHEDPRETWAGLSRVSAFRFSDDMERAITCLIRIRRAHPNEPLKPSLAAGVSK